VALVTGTGRVIVARLYAEGASVIVADSGQAALARSAEAGPDHAFAQKFRLFAGGRWPLGVVGGRLFVF
jgi:hypothetical protein